MEHNPDTVLAIGELALFLIGAILSIILLSILLIPSLMKFHIPYWVRVTIRAKGDEGSATDQGEEETPDLIALILPHLMKRGYQVIEQSEDRVMISKDGATRYIISRHDLSTSSTDLGRPSALGLSMFRQGDEVEVSAPSSILAGAGIGWVVILSDEALRAHGLTLEWSWDQAFQSVKYRPVSSFTRQLILYNPWR